MDDRRIVEMEWQIRNLRGELVEAHAMAHYYRYRDSGDGPWDEAPDTIRRFKRDTVRRTLIMRGLLPSE